MSHDRKQATPAAIMPTARSTPEDTDRHMAHGIPSRPIMPITAAISRFPAHTDCELLPKQGKTGLPESPIEEVLKQFQYWMQLDVANGTASASTLRAYSIDVQQYLVHLQKHGINLTFVTDDVLKEYQGYLLQHFRASTASRKFTSVRRFHEMAFAHGQLPSNPAAHIKSLVARTDRHEQIQCISRLQMQKILVLSDEQYQHTANEKIKALRDNPMLLLTMRHGLREVELMRLNIEDVSLQRDGENSTLRVCGRNDTQRTIPLVSQTQVAIEKWLATHSLMHVEPDEDGTPLFISLHWGDSGHGKGGRRLSTRGLRKTIDEYLEAVGAKARGISGCALRHSFAMWSLFEGADPRVLQREIGYISLERTARYRQLVDAMQANPAKYRTFLEVLLPLDVATEMNEKKRSRKSRSYSSED